MRFYWRASARNVLFAGLLAGLGWNQIQAQGPTPAQLDYPFGSRPTVANEADATAAYQNWKTNEITTNGALGYERVLWDDGSSTVSEGIGYGMLLAADFNDQPLFNNLWGYYNQFLDANGLMNWEINGQGQVVGSNAATDAEEDVAYSLLLADQRWGSASSLDYLALAKVQIARIRSTMVEAGTYVLKPGDVWGGSSIMDLSYFAPAYYRAFAQATGDASWLEVINTNYSILAANANPQTGLDSDWCNAEGTPNSMGVNYSYDACRTPWRVGMDYIYYGEPRALAFCQKLSNWAASIGANNLVSGYTQTGSPIVSYLDNAFAGPFACGASATGPSAFDEAMYTRNLQLTPSNYYSRSLNALTLALLNGLEPFIALPNEPTATPTPPTTGGGSSTSGGNGTSGGNTTTPPAASPAVLTVSNDWGAGFTGQITLTNTTSSPWNSWTVQFNLPYQPTEVWNGVLVSVKGNTTTISNAAWNAVVPVGGTVSFGFNAEPGNATQQPTNVYVNGVLLSEETGSGTSGGNTSSGSSGSSSSGSSGSSTGSSGSSSSGSGSGSSGSSGSNGGNTTTTPPASGSVAVTYQDENDWGAGFVGQMVITNNTNKTITNWKLQFTFTPSISNIWNAQIATHSGAVYTIENLSYNAVLAPGASVTVGFQGAPGGAAAPTSGSFNGAGVAISKL
ncbi:MAG: glycosyl hydrolase family 8 [Opitutales bacterium]